MTTAAASRASALDVPAPWTVAERWSDLMHGWLGEDWQAQVVTWLITKPLAILVLVLIAVAALFSV